MKEINKLKDMYTTATETRDQIIQAYNLAFQMSRMPQDLAQRYKSEFAQWTNLSAPNPLGLVISYVREDQAFGS